MSIKYHDQNVAGMLAVDATPASGSTNPVSSGGVYSALADKQNTLTFDSVPTAGSSNPVTSSGIRSALDAKADKNDLATIHQTSPTCTETNGIAEGVFFYLDNELVVAKTAIANGATFTNGTNYESPTAGGLNALKSAFDYDSGWTSIPRLPSIDLTDALYRIKGKICFLYIKNTGFYTYPADTWINILELPSKITPSVGLNGSCTSRNGNVGEYGVNTDRTVSIRMNTSGSFFSILCSYPID